MSVSDSIEMHDTVSSKKICWISLNNELYICICVPVALTIKLLSLLDVADIVG
jgi:hypothetical protein